MSNKYNKWYWPIYKWFRWEAKYFPHRFATGIKNLWKWFTVVWKDRDFDHDFIFEILKFKLNNVATRMDKTNRFVDSAKQASKIKTCVRLIQKIQDDYYGSEMHKYWDTKMRIERIKNSTNHSLEFDDTRNDLHLYLAKYPNDTRRALKSNYLKDINDPSIKQIAIVVSRIREDRAKTLLFNIVNKNIFSWWD